MQSAKKPRPEGLTVTLAVAVLCVCSLPYCVQVCVFACTRMCGCVPVHARLHVHTCACPFARAHLCMRVQRLLELAEPVRQKLDVGNLKISESLILLCFPFYFSVHLGPLIQ